METKGEKYVSRCVSVQHSQPLLNQPARRDKGNCPNTQKSTRNVRTRERKRVGIINKHRVSWDLLKLIELFEHARRCGSGTCKDAGVSFGCEVKSFCRRHSYSRRHRDSWKSLCFPELGLQRSQCRVVKDAPAREEHG